MSPGSASGTRPGTAPARDRTPSTSPARACAYRVVRRTFEQGAFTDRALAAESARLDPRERAFAMALAYTTVQRAATLDHVIERLAERPVDRLQPGLLTALRLGVAQLLLLDGVAEHAAVNESVQLAKRDSRGAGGLANAVLRRAAREGPGIIAGLSDDTPAHAAVRHSVPAWIAELLFDQLGAAGARSLLAAVNRPAESALRVNTLRATVDDVLAELPVPARRVDNLPEALVLDGPFDAHGSALWERGAIMPQSRGSMTPAAVLDPRPGERVLDLCAAPGAKTGQLAARLGAGAGAGSAVVAVERHRGRAQALARTLERLGAVAARVEVADATDPAAIAAIAGARGFERVLVDPPCSGLGTLQSRPDLRWRATPERIGELTGVQRAALAAGAGAVAPGGTLVYSVCTVTREEGDRVVERFLSGNRDFDVVAANGPGDDPYRRLRPDRDGTDGFFVAELRRR